jgi:hypothetical protein
MCCLRCFVDMCEAATIAATAQLRFQQLQQQRR